MAHTSQHRSPQLPACQTWPSSQSPPAYLWREESYKASLYLCHMTRPHLHDKVIIHSISRNASSCSKVKKNLRKFPRSAACFFYRCSTTASWQRGPSEECCLMTGCTKYVGCNSFYRRIWGVTRGRSPWNEGIPESPAIVTSLERDATSICMHHCARAWMIAN